MGICPVGICSVGICPGGFVLESVETYQSLWCHSTSLKSWPHVVGDING